ASLYTRLFDLDPTLFSPIESKLYGYTGTLTLFNPPERLDRIEITQATGDGAMARFYQRRGPGLYMCYIETGDVAGLAQRLRARTPLPPPHHHRPPAAGLCPPPPPPPGFPGSRGPLRPLQRPPSPAHHHRPAPAGKRASADKRPPGSPGSRGPLRPLQRPP